jgi:hypothetical protein
VTAVTAPPVVEPTPATTPGDTAKIVAYPGGFFVRVRRNGVTRTRVAGTEEEAESLRDELVRELAGPPGHP